MRPVIYPGSFDPMTVGHVNIVRRASALFGEVIVAVAQSRMKKPLFSLAERVAIACESTADLPGVRVLAFDGLLKDFVLQQGAGVIVRGIRSGVDFEHEYALAGMNRCLAPSIETVFLPTDNNVRFVSATFVRELLLLGDVEAYDFLADAAKPRVKALIAALKGEPR